VSSDTGADWSARRSHPREVLDGLLWIGLLYPPTDHPFTRLLMRVDWDFDPSVGSRHFTGVAVSAITKTVLMSEALAIEQLQCTDKRKAHFGALRHLASTLGP
jgi:hypothetical protein